MYSIIESQHKNESLSPQLAVWRGCGRFLSLQCHVLVYTFVVVVINKQLIETDANIIAPNIGYTLELLLDLQLSIFVRRNVALVSNM